MSKKEEMSWAAASFELAQKTSFEEYRSLIIDAMETLRIASNSDEIDSAKYRLSGSRDLFARCFPEPSQDDDDDDDDAASFSSRLSLYKYLIYKIPVLRRREDLKRPLLALLSFDISKRWALTGWAWPIFEETTTISKSVWQDNPIYEDMPGSSVWSDFREALRIFDACWEEEDRMLESYRQSPSWFLPPKNACEQFYRPYIIELWQIIALTLARGLTDACEASKENEQLSKCIMKCKEIVDKQIARGEELDGLLIYKLWLAPIRRLEGLQDCDLKKWFDKLHKLIKKRSSKVHPLSMLRDACHGVKILQPEYVDIRDPKFYTKAKELGQNESEKTKHTELTLKRNLRREKRTIGKQVHREAKKLESELLEDVHRHSRKRVEERKRTLKVITSDAAEVEKMKTYGGTMDTSIAPYRAGKRSKIAKGTPQK